MTKVANKTKNDEKNELVQLRSKLMEAEQALQQYMQMSTFNKPASFMVQAELNIMRLRDRVTEAKEAYSTALQEYYQEYKTDQSTFDGPEVGGDDYYDKYDI